MKSILLALSLATLALPLAAQDQKKAEPAQVSPLVSTAKPPEMVQKLIMLQYVDPNQITDLLRVFNATLYPNSAMHALAVRATPDTMAAVEDAIKRLDVAASAPKNIDLTVYLVVGSAGDSPAANTALPKELDPVVTQLKNAFAFKNYGLLDILSLRVRTGQNASTTSSAAMHLPSGTQSFITNFRIRSASIGADGSTVRIDALQAGYKVPVATGSGWTYQDLGTNADVDIKEGQKVVVGRLGISTDQALFLVLMAKIVP
jgi:hypothetical protein